MRRFTLGTYAGPHVARSDYAGQPDFFEELAAAFVVFIAADSHPKAEALLRWRVTLIQVPAWPATALSGHLNDSPRAVSFEGYRAGNGCVRGRYLTAEHRHASSRTTRRSLIDIDLVGPAWLSVELSSPHASELINAAAVPGFQEVVQLRIRAGKCSGPARGLRVRRSNG